MRDIILYIAMSLDGYIADETGGVDWLLGDGSDPDADVGYTDFYETIGTLVMGRTTYDQVLGFGTYPYKDKETYIITSRLGEPEQGVHFHRGSPEGLLSDLRRQEGGGIWVVGGAHLARSLVRKDLIDRYEIALIPTLLGGGLRLFEGQHDALPLSLRNLDQANGMALLSYRRK